MEHSPVLIIGAGPAGLTAAYALSRSGINTIVLEKDQTVGGIARTVNYKGYYFDIGGHRFFTKIEAVDTIWKEVLGKAFLRRNRLSRIYYNKKFFYYPLRPMNALFGLGIWNSLLILSSYVTSRIFPYPEEKTFEQWVSNRFGKRLFNTFFKTYTEKVWGISCREISAEWAGQRVQGLSLMTALKNAIFKSGKGNKKNQVIKTLIDAFDYPKLGPGMMWNTIAEIVQKNGTHIQLEKEVSGIHWSNNQVTALEIKDNERRELLYGDHFISSMPLRELIQKFTPEVPPEVLRAANNLKYRDFLTVALIIQKPVVFPDTWIYIHDPEVKVGRIQNFKNWSPFMVPDPGKTCLGLEFFCFEGDSLWNMPDQELIELAKREIEQLGFVHLGDIEDGTVVRMPKTYPIYDSTFRRSLEVVKEFLGQFDNFQVIGRNGMHRYNNQDHSMLTALLSAENIQGAKHNLWSVNAEEDYLEEVREDTSQDATSDELIRSIFSRLDKFALATAVGSVSGLLVFIATVWLVILGGPARLYLELLNQYFFGYTLSLPGAFIGMAYSFCWGFLFGWLFAYLRNLLFAYVLYRMKRKTELFTFRDFLDHF